MLADGSIAWVDKDNTIIFYPTKKTVKNTETNNLFFALRGAGSSFGIVTEFLYMIHEKWVNKKWEFKLLISTHIDSNLDLYFQTPTRLGTQPERTWTNLNKSGLELTLFSNVTTRTRRRRRTTPNLTLQNWYIGLYLRDGERMGVWKVFGGCLEGVWKVFGTLPILPISTQIIIPNQPNLTNSTNMTNWPT